MRSGVEGRKNTYTGCREGALRPNHTEEVKNVSAPQSRIAQTQGPPLPSGEDGVRVAAQSVSGMAAHQGLHRGDGMDAAQAARELPCMAERARRRRAAGGHAACARTLSAQPLPSAQSQRGAAELPLSARLACGRAPVVPLDDAAEPYPAQSGIG